MFKYLLSFLLLYSFLHAKQAIIATGSEGGNYYQVGKELNKSWYKGKAKVINTQGSVENLLLISEKKANLALTQGDALEFLDIFYQSTGQKSDDFVKIVSELYTETLHIIVNKKSTIKTLEDLNGKVMVSGGKKSGSSVTAGFIKNNFDIEFGSVLDVSIERGLELLKRNKVDVVFYVTRAPSNLLMKYKNHIKVLNVNREIQNNKHIQIVKLPKLIYDFILEDTYTYGVNSYIIAPKKSNTKKKSINLDKQYFILNIPTKTLKKYNNKYGNQALLRINYFNEKLQELQNEKDLVKLIKVNDLVNKINYLKDSQHWRKKEYWSKPLEFIGTGYGDSEEFALMKYTFLVKLGMDPKKFKVLDLKEKVKLKEGKRDSQNIVLAYYHKTDSPAIILSNKFTSEKLFLLKENQKFKILNKAKFKLWGKVFTKDFSEKDIDKIISRF